MDSGFAVITNAERLQSWLNQAIQTTMCRGCDPDFRLTLMSFESWLDDYRTQRKKGEEMTLDAEDIRKSIKGDSQQLQVTIGDVIFKPFCETYGRHSVYLDIKLNRLGL